ncbi:MAG: DUF4124 domain-containing protein [Pseudomonadota bacterium]
MLLKIIVLLVVAACIAPFFIKGPGGEPLMTVDDWFEPSESADQDAVVVYKWQDADGTWHYTDELPPDVEGVVVSLDEPINLLPPPKSSAPKATQTETERLATGAEALPGGLTISSDQMREMMDTVGGLQEDLENREQEIRQRSREH